ncbi:MAG TPA: VOC family protein [Kiloniellales bacterium]|nr:VOC family protein [Kiloniellales bacterium]
MIRHFDHVTVVVRDLAAARRFFALLGFAEDKAVVIRGETFARYMGVPGIEADHVTLYVPGREPRFEVQLLHFRQPEPVDDRARARLDRLGFNHVCFAVDDLEAALARLTAAGVKQKSDLLDFHSRKLVFLDGPEGITVELAEWR